MKSFRRERLKHVLRVALVLIGGVAVGESDATGGGNGGVGALRLPEVLASVTAQYPPFLSALIERDIASGRLKSAKGAFDFNMFARAFGSPAGYYNSGTLDTGFEQFTGIWGATIFGGYRITGGDVLPDYDPNRTQRDGEAKLGLRVPLLKDGSIDRRRADVMKARLDKELADPFIQRQQLDFVRAATVAYYGWLGSGQRLRIAENLLAVASDRADGLSSQAASGLIAPIVLTDNRRLVVSREIGLVQARRRFEASGLALSLFFRDGSDEPVVADRSRLPADFPKDSVPTSDQVAEAVELALQRRPEVVRYRLAAEKLDVDRRLAKNQMLPNVDLGVTASQDFGSEIYKDKDDFEVQAGVEVRMPLQRRSAKGRLEELEGQISQISNERRFAQDRIRMEVRDAFSALQAADAQIRQTSLNVELARELQAAEADRFRSGAADLLALQLREQATFDAEVLAVDAQTEFFRALADYHAASVAELPSRPEAK